ncbi:SAM-dependent methyltransferase [Geomonas sp. RF6]|uniref:SAM-dependent methyltransferase n=1 Tax=Geomonas sp. RF6 TaxID=2897342 RepID=UPI001E2D9D76|nr:SAM-dependent methyltransferase [Geomonas sp. RF6]UFS71376.1 SAM-dependent methyltransferase [Geomonas sp. RF6]
MASTSAYDPRFGVVAAGGVGSGRGQHITLKGQDVSTAGLARMNMILHNFPVLSGNTLAAPKFKYMTSR